MGIILEPQGGENGDFRKKNWKNTVRLDGYMNIICAKFQKIKKKIWSHQLG